MPYKFNESRRHKIPKARYRVTNWPAYDAALMRRASLTLWFTEEAVEAWYAQATGERGAQPVYSAIAIETSPHCAWYFISRCVKPRACCGRCHTAPCRYSSPRSHDSEPQERRANDLAKPDPS